MLFKYIYSCIESVLLCVCVFSDIVNTTIDGVAVTKTKFEPTKKMSTYLLAIVVSDYSHLSATQGETLVAMTLLIYHFHHLCSGS